MLIPRYKTHFSISRILYLGIVNNDRTVMEDGERSTLNTGWRLCPRCQTLKWWDVEKKGAQWYVRRRVRKVTEFDGEDEWETTKTFLLPSPYCRSCMNQDRKNRRKRDRALARLDQLDPAEANELRAREHGQCSACGVHTADRTYIAEPYEAFLCALCLGCFETCGADATVARQQWLALFLHISHEAKLTTEWEARQGDGRKRKWHQGNPEVTDDSPPHVHCIMMEKQWRKIMQWLNAEERVAAVPTAPQLSVVGPMTDGDELPDDVG